MINTIKRFMFTGISEVVFNNDHSLKTTLHIGRFGITTIICYGNNKHFASVKLAKRYVKKNNFYIECLF